MAFPWLYITLGLGWLVFGLAVLVGRFNGPWTTITVGDARFSAGWLAIALGLYNLVRWYHRQGMSDTRAWEQTQRHSRQKQLDLAKTKDGIRQSGLDR
ncbi:MAG: hypothetical protein ACKOS8_16825 [Gemmataceae bacterium]